MIRPFSSFLKFINFENTKHLALSIYSIAFLLFIGIYIVGCTRNDNRNQTKFYLHSLGDNEHSGSLDKPFKTVQAIETIEFKPGDSIFLHAGSTFSGTLKLNLNGDPTNPIVLTSYGKGRAQIDGDKMEACIIGGSGFHLKSLIFKGSGRKSGNSTSGLILDQAADALLEGVKCTGFQKSGLLVQNSENIQVMDVHAVNNGSIGICVRNSRKCVIKDCLAENNPGDPTNLTNHSGNGILVGESNNILIDRCVATNNGWNMPRIGNGPVGIWAYQTDSIIIQYCISYRNKTSKGAKDGGGFDFDGGVTNSIIQYCLSYENEGAGYGLFQYPGADPWINNIIRYNLSINDAIATDGAGGIFIWNGGEFASEISDCYVHNNVIYNETKPAVVFEPASEHINFNFNNNLFVGSGNIIEGPSSGDSFIGNVWWQVPDSKILFRGYKNLTTWANETGQEKMDKKLVGMQVDPGLNGGLKVNITDPYDLTQLIGYRLDENSLLRDRGVDLEKLHNLKLPEKDFYGGKALQGNAQEPGIYEISE